MAGLLTAGALREAAIADTLKAWASRPWDWPRTNCGVSVLAYVETVRGRCLAPSPHGLGEVSTGRMLARAGGFEAYCAGAMEQLGCRPTETPARGDVGLVELPSGLTACLCLGPSWAARGDGEVVTWTGPAARAWRVECPRP